MVGFIAKWGGCLYYAWRPTKYSRESCDWQPCNAFSTKNIPLQNLPLGEKKKACSSLLQTERFDYQMMNNSHKFTTDLTTWSITGWKSFHFHSYSPRYHLLPPIWPFLFSSWPWDRMLLPLSSTDALHHHFRDRWQTTLKLQHFKMLILQYLKI